MHARIGSQAARAMAPPPTCRHSYNVAIMMDTEGSEVHLLAADPVEIAAGELATFSVRPAPTGEAGHWFSVSYDAFVDDIQVGLRKLGSRAGAECARAKLPLCGCVCDAPGGEQARSRSVQSAHCIAPASRACASNQQSRSCSTTPNPFAHPVPNPCPQPILPPTLTLNP